MKKLLSGKREKQIVIGIIALVACGLLYYFLYMPKVKEKQVLIEERDMVLLKLTNEEEQTAKVQQLKVDLNELNSSMSVYPEKYFVDELQERYIYIMSDIIDKSEITLLKSTYSANADEIFAKALLEIKKIDDSSDEEVNEDELLKTNVMEAKLEVTGTYNQIKNFISLATENKEKILIKSVAMETKEKIVTVYVSEELDPLLLSSVLNDEGNIVLNSTIILEFYSIPDAAKYGEPENLDDWSLKNSVDNPFEAGNLNVHPIEKQQIFVFDNGDYSAGDVGKEEITIVSEDGRDYVTYSYSLVEENEKYIPLESKNIIIEEGQNVVGLIVKSDEVSSGKIYITLIDANGKPQTIELASETYWTGWASLSGVINSDMAYPIKVSRLEVHKEPAEVVEGEEPEIETVSGILTLDSIFAGKTTIFRLTPAVTEETLTE